MELDLDPDRRDDPDGLDPPDRDGSSLRIGLLTYSSSSDDTSLLRFFLLFFLSSYHGAWCIISFKGGEYHQLQRGGVSSASKGGVTALHT